jgi:hypothetical protein
MLQIRSYRTIENVPALSRPSTVGSNRLAVTTLTLPAVAEDHIGVDKAGPNVFFGVAHGLAQRRTVFLVESPGSSIGGIPPSGKLDAACRRRRTT